MSVHLYHRPKAEDLTLADVIVDTLDVGATSDKLGLSHDGTDAYFKTDDGIFIFQTDEGTDTLTQVHIKPKGTSQVAIFELWDTDTTELELWTSTNRGYVQSGSGALGFQASIVQDIRCWESIASGNPSLILYGWNTAGGDKESTELTMDDTNDEFLIQAADSANHEGITVSLPEANQQFRIRPGTLSLYDATTPATFSTIKQSDAEGIASSSDLRIGVDPTCSSLWLFNRDDIATDMGESAKTHPTLFIANDGATEYAWYDFDGIGLKNGATQYKNGEMTHTGDFYFTLASDRAAGNTFIFWSDSNIELTDTNGRQAWMYLEPKVLQTSTAAFDGLYININGTVTDTYGDGSTGDGNNLLNLADNDTSKFVVSTIGNAGLGVTAFGTSGTNVLGITADGTVPSTSPAGMVQIYADDTAAGATTATLAIRTEETVATEALIGDSTLNVWINGTEYHLLLRKV